MKPHLPPLGADLLDEEEEGEANSRRPFELGASSGDCVATSAPVATLACQSCDTASLAEGQRAGEVAPPAELARKIQTDPGAPSCGFGRAQTRSHSRLESGGEALGSDEFIRESSPGLDALAQFAAELAEHLTLSALAQCCCPLRASPKPAHSHSKTSSAPIQSATCNNLDLDLPELQPSGGCQAGEKCPTVGPSQSNVGCATPPDACGDCGPESGDFSLTSNTTTTTTEDTVIAAEPPNVNVTSAAGGLGSAHERRRGAPDECGEKGERFGHESEAEGLMEELACEEGAGSVSTDLDSGHRTEGWGCSREREDCAKFKDSPAHGGGGDGALHEHSELGDVGK